MSDTEEVDYAGMTDAEFMNQPMPEEPDEEVSSQVDTNDEEPVAEVQEEPQEQEQEPEEENVSDETEDAVESENEPLAAEKEDSATEGETEVEETKAELDYKAEYERLTAPFKASHQDIQVNNVDDALNLMKMGVDYTKKMQGLKPNMRLMKMLQNNELLDEEKLTYLIDLNNKNPEAVQKFMKESGIDPLDIDTEKDIDYTPSNYSVSDKEVELDSVLDEIRETPKFQDTIDIISNKLDERSKQVLIDTPSLISTINEQVHNGIYTQVMSVVNNERLLGRLQGLSDLEAYKHVGDVIQANGGFNTQQPTNNQAPANVQANNESDPRVEQQRNKKRKAASSTRSTKAGSQDNSNFDPMTMSDDEFMKATEHMFTSY